MRPRPVAQKLRNSAPDESARTFLPFARSNDESASHTVRSSSTMYTISFSNPINDLLRLGDRRFLLYCAKEPDIVLRQSVRSTYTVTTNFICCRPPKRFDDHKLAYYINMGYSIQADQYDVPNGAYVHLNSRTSIPLKLHRITLNS
jgi:hypothetical protein